MTSGNRWYHNRSAGGGLRFHGQWKEAATGLYYLRARDYDPETGRFLAADPAEPDYYEPESLNRYMFANANPHVYEDPTGRFSLVSVSITINVRSTLTNIAVHIAKDYLIDKARSVIGSIVASQLKSFTALNAFNPYAETDKPWKAGKVWEEKVQDLICSVIPNPAREIVWFEPTISGGYASSDGYGCAGGSYGLSGKKSSRPDFMLTKTPPSELGRDENRNIKAYLIGETKLSLTTFYNAYAKKGAYNRNQFRQIARFSRDRVYSRTAVTTVRLKI